ncbi:MAG: hypothetical protein ACOY94_11360 [Bacillota bacterium]
MASDTDFRNGWQVFRVAATYVGTVVGAGFASGQETLRFFASYGRLGLVGVAVATCLFCAFGVLVMDLGRRLRARTHREILHHVCGPYVGPLMDGLVTLFLGATLMVMVAGGGAVFAEQMGLSRSAGTLLTATLASLTILAGMRGIMAANSFVVPMLTGAVLLLSVGSIHHHGLGAILRSALPWPALAPVHAWWLAALLYVGYNLVLSISVLGPLGAEVNDRWTIVLGGVAGGLALGVLAAGIKLAVSAHLPEIGAFEIPMLFLARFHTVPVQWFYTVILWAEIYTTAIACGYGFATRASDLTQMRYREVVIGVTCVALVGSGLGFSRLVTVLYPLFGFMTLLVLVGLSLTPLRQPAK